MKRSEVLSLLLCYSFEREFKKFNNKFVIKIDNNKYPNEIFWFIDNDCFMNYDLKTNDLWCKYWDFWEYFKIKFDFNGIQVRYLIKFVMKKHFKLNEITPINGTTFANVPMEKHFKLNEITSITTLYNHCMGMEKH